MKEILNLIYSVFCLLASVFIKRDPHKIAVGSWSGKLFIDNSRYLAQYIKSHYNGYTIYWVGEEEVRDEAVSRGFEFLRKDSFNSCLKLLKCKYFFFTQMAPADISEVNVYKNAVTCYLHHGMPIKRWGDDAIRTGLGKKKQKLYKKIYCIITGNSMPYDYFATSSALHDKSNLTSLKHRGCTNDKNLKCGTPRNDFLINLTSEETEYYKDKILRELNLENKRVFLYLPTFRRKSTDIFSFSNLTEEQSDRLNEVLNRYQAVIVEKSHFAETNLKRKKNENRNVMILGAKTNVQELYIASDSLISDYSGAYLDYLFLNKPIIHFAYDYEYYKNVDSGLYYDIEDFSAGQVADTFNDLLKEIENICNNIDLFERKREYVKNKYMTYEDGNASKHIFEKVVLANENNR